MYVTKYLYFYLTEFIYFNNDLLESDSTGTCLSVKDLYPVYKALQGARNKWYFMGLALELSAADLDSIRKEFHDNPEDCLKEMLKKFLVKGDPKPTWQLFVDALKNIGHGALAEEVLL